MPAYTSLKTANGAGNPAQRILAALRADPKKTGLLSALVVVMGMMGARLVLSGSGTGATRTAAASQLHRDPSAIAESTSTSASVRSTLRSDQSPNDPSAAISAAFAKWADAPIPPVSRNLFTVRSEFFPVDGSRTTQSGPADEGFWEQLGKSLALQADQRDKRENLIANYKAQAAKLRLESTMMGPQPKAMVSGELVGEGSVVASFRVIKIEARRLIVEREGIRLEIMMK